MTANIYQTSKSLIVRIDLFMYYLNMLLYCLHYSDVIIGLGVIKPSSI